MVNPAVNLNSNLKMVFIDKIDVCLIGENRASTCSLCVKSAVSSVLYHTFKKTLLTMNLHTKPCTPGLT